MLLKELPFLLLSDIPVHSVDLVHPSNSFDNKYQVQKEDRPIKKCIPFGTLHKAIQPEQYVKQKQPLFVVLSIKNLAKELYQPFQGAIFYRRCREIKNDGDYKKTAASQGDCNDSRKLSA